MTETNGQGELRPGPEREQKTKRGKREEKRGEEILSLRWATAGRVIRTSTCDVACYRCCSCYGCCLSLVPDRLDGPVRVAVALSLMDRLTAPVRFAKRAGSLTPRPARRRQSYFFLALRAVFF